MCHKFGILLLLATLGATWAQEQRKYYQHNTPNRPIRTNITFHQITSNPNSFSVLKETQIVPFVTSLGQA